LTEKIVIEVAVFLGTMAVFFLPVSVSLFGRGIGSQLACFCAAVATDFTHVTSWAAPLLWLTAWLFAGVCLWNAVKGVATARRSKRIEDAIQSGTPRHLLPPLPAIEPRKRYPAIERGARIIAHVGFWSAISALIVFFIFKKPGL